LNDAGALLAVAHQVATAIENARLLEREQDERAACFGASAPARRAG